MNAQQHSELALLPGTLLQEHLMIEEMESAEPDGFVYAAEEMTENTFINIVEYCPAALVTRSGAELSAGEEEAAFREGLRHFRHIGEVLGQGLPHLPHAGKVWEENGTAYYTLLAPEGIPFSRAVPVPTAAYVQSLGILLCETYQALHEAGIYYGQIQEQDLIITEAGHLLLRPHLTVQGTVTEDLACLTNFLQHLMQDTPHDPLCSDVVQEALLYTYADAVMLRRALTGANGTGNPMQQKVRTGIPGLLLCLLCLAVSVFGVQSLHRMPEEKKVEPLQIDSIQPETVTVWVPLQEDTDTAEISAMYEQLAKGFQTAYPGFAADISLYVGDSFANALQDTENHATPMVFMDTLDHAVLEQAADLSALEAALDTVYAADMTKFGNTLPLGCSVPVLFYNRAADTEVQALQTITGGELPADTLYDVSAAEFITTQSNHAPEEQMQHFLDSGAQPILAATDQLARIQQDGRNAGAVSMIPVLTDDCCLLQYELYCTVNRNCTENQQKAGMLWLQYLLTEEAQHILFVEHYGAMPLHENALASAINTHDALKALGGLQFDSARLQEVRYQNGVES